MSVSNSTKLMNTETPKSALSLSYIWDKFGMLMVFAGLFLLCSFFVPYFATFINMKGLGLAISMSGMVACLSLLHFFFFFRIRAFNPGILFSLYFGDLFIPVLQSLCILGACLSWFCFL